MVARKYVLGDQIPVAFIITKQRSRQLFAGSGNVLARVGAIPYNPADFDGEGFGARISSPA
jgi:hypothetical protein